MANYRHHPAFGDIVRIVNDVRLNFGDGVGTLGEVAEHIIKTVVEKERPVPMPEHGVIPWKKGYDGTSRAFRTSDGTVFRVNGKGVAYKVSESLAQQFRSA